MNKIYFFFFIMFVGVLSSIGYCQLFGMGSSNTQFNNSMCETFISSVPNLSCKNIDIYYGYTNPFGCTDVLIDKDVKVLLDNMKLLHDELAKYNININSYWLANNMNQINYPGTFNYATPITELNNDKPSKHRVGILSRLLNRNKNKKSNLYEYRRIAKVIAGSGNTLFLPIKGVGYNKYIVANKQRSNNFCKSIKKSSDILPSSCIELQFAVGCADNVSLDDSNNLYNNFLLYTRLYANKYSVMTSLYRYINPNEVNIPEIDKDAVNPGIISISESNELQNELPIASVTGDNVSTEDIDHDYVWLLCSAFDLAHDGIAVDESIVPIEQLPDQCKIK